jgi:uncharacterized membrane protein YqhA
MAQSQQVQRLRPIPAMIFAARWLQLPLYLGLILAMGIRYHEEHQA